ncbi:hypothetical protein QO021_28555 (plasmid) [Pseudomonas amygdali pv. lachrymans]|uniref:Uncharacterized protein n=1 Tax=Pseudomonas syringae pv. maculicola str. ES4326 TaxID=629265 RepID=A0A8T8CA04_PSEYM|nr:MULTISPECIES: hypothetical protein [Pseudomonas syringae group]QHF00400.1 hypothetical protein PMA4326_028175 [Pseudomonas syringae pv. maculicola str. ES4326]UBZ00373.1 hypothetical protein LCG56_28820 [Pseudomonas cannabina pv. alisalensis]WIO61511.1 hypothetical protein QO021_28555 [Pseudomonas amygdali pv. lachrymans]
MITVSAIDSALSLTKTFLVERIGFIVFYFALGAAVTLISQSPRLADFANNVYSEQIGISTVIFMLCSSFILALVTFSIGPAGEMSNKRFENTLSVLNRVCSVGADLCLIFVSVSLVPVLFASAQVSKFQFFIMSVVMLACAVLLTNIPVFGAYVRREAGALGFRLLSFVLISLSLLLLYKAAAPLNKPSAPVATTYSQSVNQ